VLTPAALRVAGIVALFVAWGSYLSARSSQLSTRQAGAIVVGFALALIVLHVVLLRRDRGRPAPDAMLAALLGALPVVPWRTPGAGATVLLFYGIDNHVLAKGLLLAAAVYVVAWAAARQPRWLLAAALAGVAGVEVWPSSGGDVTIGSQSSGGWGRFLFTLAAIGVLLAIGRRAGGGVERNLTVAAVLLCSLAFELAPAGHRNALRDLLGIALLAGIALVVRRRLTVGMGLGIALLCLLELRSIAASGDSLAPVALFGLAGGGLFACAWLAERSGGHSSA
jgi:hypothetical protein